MANQPRSKKQPITKGDTYTYLVERETYNLNNTELGELFGIYTLNRLVEEHWQHNEVEKPEMKVVSGEELDFAIRTYSNNRTGKKSMKRIAGYDIADVIAQITPSKETEPLGIGTRSIGKGRLASFYIKDKMLKMKISELSLNEPVSIPKAYIKKL